jgi:hypothetical protein
MKTTLALLLIVTACGGSVDSPAPAACSCGWSDNSPSYVESCSAPFELISHDTSEQLDDGTVCLVTAGSCVEHDRADCDRECARTDRTVCQ